MNEPLTDAPATVPLQEEAAPGADASGSRASPGGGPAGGRRVLTGIGLAALAASAALGGNLFGLRDALLGSAVPEARAPAAGRVAQGASAVPAPETAVRSQPWWQEVATLEGTGPVTLPPLDISEDAIQWRVTPTACAGGRLVVVASAKPEPLIDGACPNADPGYSTRMGATGLRVTADGEWQLKVEQMVDVPLVEPPLPAMSAPGAAVVATGSFYRIDQNGTGTVVVHRLADGSHALRLEDFFVTQNSDLEVELSELEQPRSTDEFAASPSVTVAALDVTAGSLNFTVPAGVDPTRYRSVVIWCERLHSAYAAARLVPA